jgi:DNA-binding NarL/FixJ family response regulator
MTASPCRIVIVDDQPVFRQEARKLLEIRGSAVLAEASCAAEALAAVERLAPDAGRLDVRLGDESGHDVARRVEPARRRRDLLRRRRLCASHIVSSGAHPIRAMR